VIPQTVGAVLGLLLVIGPGLTFEVIREHFEPTAERSSFREASVVALASLAFTATGFLVLAIVRAMLPKILPDPHAWLIDEHAYLVGHYQAVAGFIVALVGLSTGFAAIASWAWFHDRGGRINPTSTGWYELFRRRVPKGTDPMVRVRLHDGTEFIGRVISYSANILPDERELVLGPPLQRKGPNEPAFSQLPDEGAWARVLIPGQSVDSFWVRYAPKLGAMAIGPQLLS
jgi:hypothetical protein